MLVAWASYVYDVIVMFLGVGVKHVNQLVVNVLVSLV